MPGQCHGRAHAKPRQGHGILLLIVWHFIEAHSNSMVYFWLLWHAMALQTMGVATAFAMALP